MIDPRIYDDMRKKDINDLTEQMELYVRQEDFTHPAFFALLRKLLVPFNLLKAITGTSEKMKIPNCDPSYYMMLNRKMRERLYPLMYTYHAGMIREGDALTDDAEKRQRTKVIKGKGWRDKIRGVVDGSEPTEEEV